MPFLYRTSLERNPENWMAHFNLRAALVRTGTADRIPDAISEYRKALQIKSDFAEKSLLAVSLQPTITDPYFARAVIRSGL